jgi:hypothetical protein
MPVRNSGASSAAMSAPWRCGTRCRESFCTTTCEVPCWRGSIQSAHEQDGTVRVQNNRPRPARHKYPGRHEAHPDNNCPVACRKSKRHSSLLQVPSQCVSFYCVFFSFHAAHNSNFCGIRLVDRFRHGRRRSRRRCDRAQRRLLDDFRNHWT